MTICTTNRRCILSTVVGQGLAPAEICLTPIGKLCEAELVALEDRYHNIKIDKYVIMPNHIHVIINLRETAGASPCPTLSDIVGAFKSLAARKCGQKGLFQSSFYDHVIRGENDYREIWEYIENNPSKWHEDRFYIET